MAAAATAQEASSSISRCTYHVFLSFRGEDTRTNFTDHLYGALRQAGIHTFLDDDGIERGERIDAELQKAIKESKISIIVFSKDYASSRWCLGELVMIMERRRTCGHTVVPVFYDVDPSQVRKQTGSFAEAFARHEKRFKEEMDKVESWRAALREVADLGGMVLDNRHEFQFIQDIVREIRERLYRPLLNVAPHLVGIDSRVKDINRWLQDGSSDVGIATIFGIGGIGKTTIAKIVYNLNFDRFQGRSFLANVKETSKKANGLVRLQNQLLSDLLNKNVNKVYSVDEGIMKIKNVICYRKVLIVLDDVEQSNQLDRIIGMHEWLYPGSKIIITTRHARLLRTHQVCVKFEVKELDDNESLQLFSWHAFGQSHPTEGYMKCSRKVVDRCGGLPLGLKVLGSSLCGRSIDVWESALQKPEAMIQEVLKINYDSLEDDHDRNLFLDIACFFVGEDKDYAIAILDACDFFTTPGIQNLIDRCLLTVEGNKLMMPQLLQDMGREIIRHESADDPGKRSRLWHHKDAFTVLKEKTGTQTVKGLIFDLRRSMEDKHGGTIISGNSAKRCHDEDYLEKSTIGNCSKRRRLSFFSWKPMNGSSENLCSLSTEVDLETKAFMKMHKLKLLQLNYVKLKGDYEDFSKNLIWLCWHGFPLESLPTNFYLEKLVALDLRHSSLKHVWKGTRFLAELKFLNLSHSHGLVGTPDFSGVPSLERLMLEDCINLVKVDESVVNLDRLVVLNLENCKNLRKLPRNIWMLKSLEDLNLSGCSKLDELPKELRKMESLKVLHVDGVSINQLHADTSDTDKLILLSTTSWHSTLWSWLSPTKNPHSTSFSLALLPNSLVSLSLRNCNLSDDAISYGLASLPSLQNLNLSENPFHSLPKSIKGLTMLNTLILINCRELKLIPEFPNSLKHVTLYHVTFPRLMILGCDKLVEIGGLFKLEPLENADVTVLKNLGLSNLESLRSIEVDIISDMYSLAKRTPVQVLHECDIVSVFLPGSEIPRCFSLQSTGSLISFDVPPLVGHKICGLNLCMLYALDMEYGWTSHYDCAIISNKTKRVRWSYTPICYAIPGAKEDMLWLSHWKIGDQLEGGDHIDISMVFSYWVKMCGISLVYEPEDKNTQSNTDETVRSAFPWYQTLTLTKAGADAYFCCHHSFSFYLCKVLSNQKYYYNTYTKDHMELDTCFICEDKLTEERKKIVYYIQGNEKVCPKQVDTKEALDRHSPSKYNRFEEEIEISAVESPIESQKEALVTAAKNVPSQVMAGISKHDKAPSTPQCALSAMGEACSRGDITAIHQILVTMPYRDTGVSETSDMLETMLRHGDHAFYKRDFETAIDYYSQFIDAMVSPVIFARRSLCYLFCDQLDDALRDAMQAQCVYPKWPTAFYLQSVALAKLGMQKAAAGLLIEAARLEEKSQQEVLKGGKAKISAVDRRIKPEMMQTQEAERDALLVQSAGNSMSLMSAVEDAEMIPEASGQQGSKATLQSIESEIVQIEEMHAQSHPSSALGQNDMPIEISLDTAIQNVVVNSVTQPEEGKLLLMLGLTEPPKEEEWKNAKEIHLMHNKFSKLPENPRCPMLLALFLQRNSKLRLIPHSFFDDMPALQVLNLSNTAIRSLPESLFRLVSLKRLFLNDCRNFMMLSPKVGELKQLEVLDLEGTEIKDLPKEMKNLTGLKCLEVSLYGYADDGRRVKKSNAMVPSGIISALSEVEELNIDVNPDDDRWDACAEAIVNEVCSLMKLSTLQFYFPRVELLSHFQWNSTSMVYPMLSNFRFIVGDHVGRIMTRLPRDVEFELERWDRCLKYVNGVGVPEEIKKVLRHATAFHLDRHTTVEKLTEFGIENIEHLKCCVVGECNKLQVIIDAADFLEEDDSGEIVPKLYGDRRTGLESLEFLYIYYMKNLRTIWEGPLQKKGLILLKSLTLHTCPQLTTIFTRELLDNLCNLEELTVENCPAITSIVSCETFAEHNTAYFLPKLRKISLHFLPELTIISNGLYIAPKLEWMSFYYCLNLKSLAIEEVSSKDVKKIKGESSWWEALERGSGWPDYFDDIFVPVNICD